MKGIAAAIFSIVLFGISAVAGVASSNPFSIYNERSPTEAPSSQIKGIQVFGISSGIAYTSDSLYRTYDNGETWARLPVGDIDRLPIANVWFADENIGIALLADNSSSTLRRYDTADGGKSWFPIELNLDQSDLSQDLVNADLESAKIWIQDNGTETFKFRLESSSNFNLAIHYYRRHAGDLVWSGRSLFAEDAAKQKRFSSLKADYEEIAEFVPGRYEFGNLPADPVIAKDQSDAHSGHEVHSNWYLTQSGSCFGFKSGCVQTTKLYKYVSANKGEVLNVSFEDITPPAVVELDRSAKELAKIEADQNRTFAAPPGGSIRTSLNRGFDKCQAGTIAQMQLWWDNSYFFDTNIYFSGRARACPTQPFTNNPAWIDAISAQGWGIIPTVVGYQSPCSVSSTIHKHSSDPAVSETQGRGEADIAAADAASIGLTAGSVLYYDMEQYNVPSPDTLGCRAATVAFLKGWTERIRELGYVSGVYGSPRNAQEDWVTLPPASRMDAIWMARWDNIPSVWTYGLFPNFPTNFWNNHQRIKQWQAPHNETWGGVTFNIDGNIADGPVAGIPAPRNKVADFDGDQKTDISVFRPATGQWFVAGTLGPSYNIYEFGTAEDILAPGDYDGDGKTDLVVFRPSNSTWYLRTKGSFNVRQYGEPGDIPAPADYNGDRRTDIAVFRPSTGTWYIAFSDSLNSFIQIPFGQIGDRPAAADYDGDGKADVAVWRPSNGTWYVQGSAGSYFVATWGEAGDIPAQADYDGDGKADLGVFRPSAGAWYLQRTTEGFLTQQFGADGDQPATGDYDGDGRYDIAVFRPSNNTWYTSQSQAGYIVREFGALNDKPIPAAYLPRP